MSPHPAGVWRHAEFRKLWAARTASGLGDQVTLLALPLLAILTLHASPAQLGLLRAAGRAPFLLLSLPAGVWVDRRRRRPLLIGADLGRAGLLAVLVLAGVLGGLRLPHLYAVAFLVGVLTVGFDLAHQSFLPAVVGRARLVEGNGMVVVSGAVVQLVGPGLAGVLVQFLTAPVALLVDALSFVVSVLCLGAIRTPEPAPPQDARRQVWAELSEGVRLVLGTPLLRANTLCRATLVFCSSIVLTIYLLYLQRDLGLAPVAIGALVAASGPSSLLAGLLAGRLARSPALGWVMVGAAALAGAGNLLLPLARGPASVTIPLLVLAGWLSGGAGTLYDLLQLSLRQVLTPAHLLGRMTATARFVILGATPLGALLGGLLGGTLGLRPTLLVGAVGSSLACLWLLCSPVRALRAFPTAIAEAPDQPPAEAGRPGRSRF